MRRPTPVSRRCVCALLVASGLAVTGCGSGEAQPPPAGATQASMPQGPPPALVRVAPVVMADLNQRWDAIGRLVAVKHSAIAAEVDGKIVAMPVDEGGAVVGGETVVAEVEPVWTELDAQRAKAELASAEAELNQAQLDLKYLEELDAVGSAKPREVALARTKVQSRQAAVDAAQATLAEKQQQINRLKVVSPFDGFVVKKLVEAGQWVTRGTPVVEVISRGEIDAVVDVPEQLVNRVALDMPVEVVVEPLGREIEGRVVAINPSGSTAARTFPVKIRLSDDNGLLKPGMSVVAHVPMSETRPVLAVPRDAVQRTDMGWRVWLNLNGAAMPVGVRVLFGHENLYAVEALPGPVPLAPGMPVVIEGAERLFPTQPLNVAGASPAGGRAAAPAAVSETQPSAPHP